GPYATAARADRRPVTCARLADQCARLLDRRSGCLDVLVGYVDLGFQAVENFVVEDLPPRSAVEGIVRLTRLPTVLLLVSRGRVEHWTLVIGPYGASGHERKGRRDQYPSNHMHHVLACSSWVCLYLFLR